MPTHARPPQPLTGSPPRYRVTALIPACNSADCIAATIVNLWHYQTRRPDRIIVVANNCADDTVKVVQQTAETLGTQAIHVIDFPNNPHKKAGALNHALEMILPHMGARDLLLIQDDDTIPDADFVENGMRRLAATRNRADAVGPVFYGCKGGGLLGLLQRNEYIRFADTAAARKGKDVIVLSGTAAMFRADTLQAVSLAMRNGRFDGEGYVYNIHSQTEDHYLTMVMHTMGFRTMAPPECRVVTDVMRTLKALWHQRIRWQHGTVDDLRSFGWTSVTREAILRQTATALLIVFTLLYPAWLGMQMYQHGPGVINPTRHWFWFAVAAFVVMERITSVRDGGWRSMLVAALIVPEWLYDTFRQVVFVTALYKSIKGGATRWHHT